jgi:hypothetical protein
VNLSRIGSGLVLCAALGCGGDDGGSEKDPGGSSIDGGKVGGDGVTGRGGSDLDGGKTHDGGSGTQRGGSEADGGTPESGGHDTVDAMLDRLLVELANAEQLECDCLAGGDGDACEEDPDDVESALEWERYTKCVRDGVALDRAGSAAPLDCSLVVLLRYNQCVAELDSCDEGGQGLAACDAAALPAGSGCPALPAGVAQAWEACNQVDAVRAP